MRKVAWWLCFQALLCIANAGGDAKNAECNGIGIFPGLGSFVDIEKGMINKVGDATYSSSDNSVSLAHKADKQGALSFGSAIEKLKLEKSDFGIQFGFRIRSTEDETGYGMILNYGGNLECVEKRVKSGDNTMFDAKQKFCPGITFAAWADGKVSGIFIVINGQVQTLLPDSKKIGIFDQ
mmetsp:Transcript_8761/g.13480  ORF Transcript_8761/g.13480 Transcript_8761/m.13480 type:complete len:180 (-) Transcript_8761:15-554(-)